MRYTVETLVVPASRGEDRAGWFETFGGCVLALADGAIAAEAVVAAVGSVVVSGRLGQWGPVLEALDGRLGDAGRSTAVVVELRDRSLFGASVGDSCGWLFGRVRVELTAGQRRKPLIGSGRARVHEFRSAVEAGDRVLLASDGLSKYASAREIEAAARDSSLAASVERIRLPSGQLRDDVAIVRCRVQSRT